MTLTLSHADVLRPGTAAHVARASLTPARPKTLHDHDFFEVLWVQNGAVRHHLPDGRETLTEGDLVCLAPGQAHGLQGRGEAALIASISLHPDVVTDLGARYPNLTSAVFGGTGPIRFHRDIRQLAAVNQAALALERSALDRLAAEAFLLPLCADLARRPHSLAPDAPDWLRDACLSAEDPAVFRAGSAGLVALTGKAHAHVSRSVRRYLDQTPSDYINAIRMHHAARALVTDDEPLTQIASDCGISNLSHFHKLFRAHHGMTPLKYRQRYQRRVLQP